MCEMEKCVRMVVLSGPSSKAANGLLSCAVEAVFCRASAEARAAEIWSCGSGLRLVFLEEKLSGGWLARGVEGGCGKLAIEEGAVDAGVPLTLRFWEVGVGGPLCRGTGEDMLVDGEMDRLAGFRAIADGDGVLTDLPLS